MRGLRFLEIVLRLQGCCGALLCPIIISILKLNSLGCRGETSVLHLQFTAGEVLASLADKKGCGHRCTRVYGVGIDSGKCLAKDGPSLDRGWAEIQRLLWENCATPPPPPPPAVNDFSCTKWQSPKFFRLYVYGCVISGVQLMN